MGSVTELARPEIQKLVPYEAANYADGTLQIKLAKRSKSETKQVKVNIE